MQEILEKIAGLTIGDEKSSGTSKQVDEIKDTIWNKTQGIVVSGSPILSLEIEARSNCLFEELPEAFEFTYSKSLPVQAEAILNFIDKAERDDSPIFLPDEEKGVQPNNAMEKDEVVRPFLGAVIAKSHLSHLATCLAAGAKVSKQNCIDAEKLERHVQQVKKTFKQISSRDSIATEEIFLMYANFGEFLRKIYPGKSLEQIKQALTAAVAHFESAKTIKPAEEKQLVKLNPLFTPIKAVYNKYFGASTEQPKEFPNSASRRNVMRQAKEDAAQARVIAKETIRGVIDEAELGAGYETAKIGLACYEYLLSDEQQNSESTISDQNKINNARSFIAGLAKPPLQGEYQSIQYAINQIEENAYSLKIPEHRAQGKQLATMLQEKLTAYLLNPAKKAEGYPALQESCRRAIQKFTHAAGVEWLDIFNRAVGREREAKKEIKSHTYTSAMLENEGSADDEKSSSGAVLLSPSPTTTQLPAKSRYKQVLYTLWKYLFAPLLLAGLFFTLGFVIYQSSALAVTGFLAAGLGGLAIPILAALALAVITNLIIHWLKVEPVDTLTCQVVGSAKRASMMLEQWHNASEEEAKTLLGQGVLAYIEEASDLLNPQGRWRHGLVRGDQASDYQALSAIAVKLKKTSRLTLTDNDKQTLSTVFDNLALAEIDPAYRPPFFFASRKDTQASTKQKKYAFALSLLAALLLAGCVTVLALVFMQTVVVTMAGSLLLAAVLGFSAWALTRYILDHTSGGAYAELAAIFGAAAITLLILSVVSVVSPFALFTLVPFVGFSWLAARFANQTSANRLTEKSAWSGTAVEFLLIAIKITLFLSLLFLAFLSIAALFNLGSLGPFSSLMAFAFNTIVKMLGSNGLVSGAQWFGAFAIGIFTVASFGAFNLLKDFLQTAPSSAQTAAENKDRLAVLSIGAKLILTSGLIICLTAMPSAFVMGGTVSLLPIFLIVATLMPWFSGNINLPFVPAFNRWFNRTLGIQPFSGPNKMLNYAWRELKVTIMLGVVVVISYFSLGASSAALAILLMGSGVAMLFRCGSMLWNAYGNPKAFANSYMQALPAISVPLPEFEKTEYIEMQVRYSPHWSGGFGDVAIVFKLPDQRQAVFKWGGQNWYRIIAKDYKEVSSIVLKAPLELSPAQYAIVHEEILGSLNAYNNPPTLAGKEYNSLTNHSGHGALQVIKMCFENFSNTDQGPLYPDQLPEIERLLNDGFLTPQAIFVSICDIMLEVNRLQRTEIEQEEIAVLRANDLARLDIKIAKAKASRFVLDAANYEGDEFLKALTRLQKLPGVAGLVEAVDTIKEVKGVSSIKHQAAEHKKNRSPSGPALSKSFVSVSLSNSHLGATDPVESGLLSAKSMATRLVASMAVIWWVASVITLILFGLLITPIGQLLLAASIIQAIFIPMAALLLGMSAWCAYQLWSSYSSTDKLKFVMGGAGLLIAISLVAIPAVLSAPFFLWLMFSFSVGIVSYLFGKHGLQEYPIETVWQLLARKDAKGNNEIESLLASHLKKRLKDAEKPLLLQFVNAAIYAMEKELMVDEQRSEKLAIWDGVEAGGSTQFEPDLRELKELKNQLEASKQSILPLSPSLSPPLSPKNAFGNETAVSEVCARLKSFSRSSDNSSNLKKTAVVLLVAVFIALAIASAFFIATSSSVLLTLMTAKSSAVFLFSIVGVALVAAKAVMERFRQRANHYHEYLQLSQRPSQRITAERLAVWLMNTGLLAITIAVGFVLGVTSVALLMLIVFLSWGIGQMLSSAFLQTPAPPLNSETTHKQELMLDTVEPPREVRSYELQDNYFGSGETITVSKTTERKHSETKAVSPVKSAMRKPPDPVPIPPSPRKFDLFMEEFVVEKQESKVTAKNYFNIQRADNQGVLLANLAMRSFFVAGAVMGGMNNRGFSDAVFKIAWSMVNGFGSAPGIHANIKNNGQDADSWENSLVAFEATVATFLIASTTLSAVGHYTGHASGHMAFLGGYGFALSMTASAMRAGKNTWMAWNELSPRYLLEQKLKRRQALVEKIAALKTKQPNVEGDRANLIKEQTQLLNEAIAIAKVQRHVIEDDDSKLTDIFARHVSEEDNVPKRLASGTSGEEQLFVDTLLAEKQQKFIMALTDFVGYSAATICFWLLALNPVVGISLLSFGGGIQLFLVSGGVLSLVQIVADLVLKKSENSDKSLRDGFLGRIANKVNEYPDNSEEALQAFFKTHRLLDTKQTAAYRIAYYLRRAEIKGSEESFLESLDGDPQKEQLLQAAVDEFVILMKNNPDKDIPKILQALDKEEELNQVTLAEDTVLREKMVTSIIKSGFFTPEKLRVIADAKGSQCNSIELSGYSIS